MAFLLGSFAATRSSSISAYPFRSLPVRRNAESIESINLTCKKRLLGSSQRSSKGGENEDLKRSPKKISVPGSLLERFRSKKALSVTDIIDTEWCEKQMEFRLFGKPRSSQAMRAGTTRHEKLAEEVVRKIKVGRLSFEDVWAEKFINFIIGTNQLCVDGLTRELPLLGFVKGVWMVGVVDEIQMPMEETTQTPSLIEIKTRSQSRLPIEPQKRKGRFQLMCYKYLWDNVVTNNLPVDQFFDYFDLSRSYVLPKEIQEGASKLGFVVKNLEDW